MQRRAAGRTGGDATDDERRFAELYPRLRRFAAAVAPPEVDPDDLVQEALSRALRTGPLREIDNLAGYLHTAVLNLARNHRRSWARRLRALSRIGPPPDTTDTYPSDLADLLRLPPDARAVLYLVEVEGRPFDEVAATLGVTPEAARTRASRARRSLRELLDADIDLLEVRDAHA